MFVEVCDDDPVCPTSAFPPACVVHIPMRIDQRIGMLALELSNLDIAEATQELKGTVR